jgi:hypothetical protein
MTVNNRKMCHKDHLAKAAINAVNKDIFLEIALRDKDKVDMVVLPTIPVEEKRKNATLVDNTATFPEIVQRDKDKEDKIEDNKDQWLVSNVERKAIEPLTANKVVKVEMTDQEEEEEVDIAEVEAAAVDVEVNPAVEEVDVITAEKKDIFQEIAKRNNFTISHINK